MSPAEARRRARKAAETKRRNRAAADRAIDSLGRDYRRAKARGDLDAMRTAREEIARLNRTGRRGA